MLAWMPSSFLRSVQRILFGMSVDSHFSFNPLWRRMPPAIAAAATKLHVARNRQNACDRRAETSGFNMDKTGKSDRRRV
jgi:hypothetical protein